MSAFARVPVLCYDTCVCLNAMLRSPEVKMKRAFTLTELLVVMLIMAILIALFLPAAASALDRAYRLKCANNMRQVGLTVLMSAHKREGRLPDSLIWKDPKDHKPVADWQPEILLCPSDIDPMEGDIPGVRTSYFYTGSGKRLSDLRNPTRFPLIFERLAGFHKVPDCRHVFFPGGQVEFVDEDYFRKCLQESGLSYP